jgi:Protein of unknown function (DUF3606)
MADDESKAGAADRARVNVNEAHELRYWTGKWNVTEQQLRDAVKKVGVMTNDVAQALGKEA